MITFETPIAQKLKKLLPILFLFPYFLFGQNNDSLKLALKNAKHDTTKIKLRTEIGEIEMIFRIPYWDSLSDDCKLFADKCTAHHIKKFYLKHHANALHITGFLTENLGDISKALYLYHKSLKIREEILDKEGIATSLNNIGAIYQNQGDIPKALDCYLKSLKITEEIMNKEGIAGSLNNIGLIYQNQGDIPKALECYHKSIKIQEEILDKEGLATSLNNIGAIYQNQGEIPEALEFFHKSLKIREEISDKEGIAYSLNNIGNTLVKQGEITLAAIYAKRSMHTAEELGFPENIRNAATLLKKIYKKQNNFQKAFEMYELEVKMRDSINNEETQKAAVKKQMQYQYETQAKQLQSEQDKKDLLAKEELKQKEKERNYFVTGFALVIILALLIFRSYRQKQKANVIISQQKYEVEESRKEILDSIHYAKRIQKAHLPSEKQIEKNLSRLKNKG